MKTVDKKHLTSRKTDNAMSDKIRPAIKNDPQNKYKEKKMSTWPSPKYSRSAVNRAGDYLKNLETREGEVNLHEWIESTMVLTNWRACHGYPINTFKVTLRDKLKLIDDSALVAQRLKRMPSIVNKLVRYQNMSLARMQDIGGLRAVVSSIDQLKQLKENYARSKFSHSLVSEYDYVAEPKTSGYRGIHLVYKYKGQKISTYDGLQIELQLRTRLQHAWATAVETVGTFLSHSLKSSEGPEAWLTFFSLIGSAFSHKENCPLVPGFEKFSLRETYELTVEEANRLGVRNMLEGYSQAVQSIQTRNARSAYYLVELNLGGEKKNVSILPFARDQLERANEEYAKAEKRAAEGEEIQVVLVAAGSVESLRRAYPNYFLDTHEFLQELNTIEKLLTRQENSKKN